MTPAAQQHEERAQGGAKHRFIAVPGSPRRTALALLAIDVYVARDVVGYGDRSWCPTFAGTPFELGTAPCDGVATDGQVG